MSRHGPQQTVLSIALSALACVVAHTQPWWAEGEHYFAQSGSAGIDAPPFGSGGECLGSNWGGAKGHFVVYRFHLDGALPNATLALRYARQPESPSRLSLCLDAQAPRELVFASTKGWGHRGSHEWWYKRVRLGDLASGWHDLRLECLADKRNTNLDGFFLGSGHFDVPDDRAAIEAAPRLTLARRDGGSLVDENLRVEDFAPTADDFYYPPEEAEERASLTLPKPPGCRGASVGDTIGEWHVVARTETPKAVVLERRFGQWGVFVYLGDDGLLAEIRKAVGEQSGLVQPARKYPAGYMDWIRKSAADVLGDRVLARGEPSFERVAGWLPEVTGYTFIATRDRKRKIAVDAEGTVGYLTGAYGTKRIEEPLFDPRDFSSEHLVTQAKRGSLGGFLPAVDYGFVDDAGGLVWEQIAFATEAGAFVGLRTEGGWRTFSLEPLTELPTPTRFFEQLFALQQRWQSFAATALEVEVPERRLLDSSLSSLVRARITYAGDRPKYGLGYYARDAHDAFPPTTLWTVEAELEWGLLDEARGDLEYYLHNLVKPDGTFDYYGPAVSEYGMMLERIVRFVRYTDDREWLAREYEVANRICEHLLKVRSETLARTEVEPGTKGLLFGSPEADTREDVEYYYSGSMWAWRGLVEWGRLLAETEQWKERGGQLLAEAEALRQDITQSLETCTLRMEHEEAPAADAHPIDNRQSSIANPAFIPPYPGIDKPFESMIQDRLASYTNYRYWLEMLSADFLSDEQATALVEFRKERQGECLGMTRFTDHLDDWPFANHARALLTLDRVDHYLLGLYGHLAHHQMRGTFSDYEQVHIHDLAERTYHADYCVPAQLTIPLLTRWMLVFEERDADVLWLCKAAPRRWFAPGQKWHVKGAPTRWGRVSLEVETEEGRVVARVTPPERGVKEIRLRVRLPSGVPVTSVRLNGRQSELDGEASTVVLRGAKEPCAVVVEY